MNRHIDNFSSDEFISLYDIWKKLVQYKKVFWGVFFTVFIIAGTKVLLTPPTYTFSQVIEIGKSPDERGVNTINVNLDEVTKKIKKVFFPRAIRAYNAQAVKKIYISDKSLMAESVGNGALILSMNGQLKDFDKYKFILQQVVAGFSEDTKEYIDYRRKTLTDAKFNLERRLVQTNSFYNDMTKKYFSEVGKRKNSVSVESKIITMYLNDQNSLMIQLSNNINMLQAQIVGTYNTRVISDVIVSDEPVSLSKSVLLILVAMVALFLGFFGVFIMNFMVIARDVKISKA